MKWDCGTRVDMVDRELMTTMRDAGCFAVWLGVESGSEAMLGSNEQKHQTGSNKTGIQDSS